MRVCVRVPAQSLYVRRANSNATFAVNDVHPGNDLYGACCDGRAWFGVVWCGVVCLLLYRVMFMHVTQCVAQNDYQYATCGVALLMVVLSNLLFAVCSCTSHAVLLS